MLDGRQKDQSNKYTAGPAGNDAEKAVLRCTCRPGRREMQRFNMINEILLKSNIKHFTLRGYLVN